MKHTGLVRKIDILGRITLPSELRKNFNLNCNDAVEIFVEEDLVILKKYQLADVFSGSMEDLIDYKGLKVSKQSILEMAEIAGFIPMQ